MAESKISYRVKDTRYESCHVNIYEEQGEGLTKRSMKEIWKFSIF